MLRDHGWVHETTSSPSGALDFFLVCAAGLLLVYVFFEIFRGRS